MCIRQDQDREKCIQPPVSHALSDYNNCHGVRPLGRHVKNWRFFHQAWIACQCI